MPRRCAFGGARCAHEARSSSRPPGAQSDPQSSLLGCPGDTFEGQGARMLYVRKTYDLPCFNHIRRVRAPCFHRPASLRNVAVAQLGIFPAFSAARGATQCPKEAQRVPKASQSHPGSIPKSFKHRRWNPSGRKGCYKRCWRYPPPASAVMEEGRERAPTAKCSSCGALAHRKNPLRRWNPDSQRTSSVIGNCNVFMQTWLRLSKKS